MDKDHQASRARDISAVALHSGKLTKVTLLYTDALEDLARDLSSSNTADKERAVSMLSSLTLYLEYHSAMMKAGVFPALIKAILDTRMVPQVSISGAIVHHVCLMLGAGYLVCNRL